MENIPKDGDFDLHLDEIALVASNIDVEPEDLPFSTQGFAVKQGMAYYAGIHTHTHLLIQGCSYVLI